MNIIYNNVFIDNLINNKEGIKNCLVYNTSKKYNNKSERLSVNRIIFR